MRNDQSYQSELKSSEVSAVRLFSPLIVGIAVCGLSFLYDQAVVQWVKGHDWTSLKSMAGFLGKWGDGPALMFFGCIGLGIALLLRSRVACKVLLCMMIAATISGAIVNSVRLLTGRARPNNTEATQEWNGLWRGRETLLFNSKYHSFPSGHTGAAFALFGVLSFAHRRHGWWALFAAAAIAWSRIYSNAHHLSDVLVGALLGLLIASFVWERIEPRVDRILGKYFD
jgi:membrane-associated phospholipid phosphatase